MLIPFSALTQRVSRVSGRHSIQQIAFVERHDMGNLLLRNQGQQMGFHRGQPHQRIRNHDGEIRPVQHLAGALYPELAQFAFIVDAGGCQ